MNRHKYSVLLAELRAARCARKHREQAADVIEELCARLDEKDAPEKRLRAIEEELASLRAELNGMYRD